MKLVVFYIPISDDQTRLMIFVFANPIMNKLLFQLLVGPIVRFFVDHELTKDKEILENLADKQMALSEMQLGQYDRVLSENRKRINRLYRGQRQKPQSKVSKSKSQKLGLIYEKTYL